MLFTSHASLIPASIRSGPVLIDKDSSQSSLMTKNPYLTKFKLDRRLAESFVVETRTRISYWCQIKVSSTSIVARRYPITHLYLNLKTTTYFSEFPTRSPRQVPSPSDLVICDLIFISASIGAFFYLRSTLIAKSNT